MPVVMGSEGGQRAAARTTWPAQCLSVVALWGLMNDPLQSGLPAINPAWCRARCGQRSPEQGPPVFVLLLAIRSEFLRNGRPRLQFVASESRNMSRTCAREGSRRLPGVQGEPRAEGPGTAPAPPAFVWRGRRRG